MGLKCPLNLEGNQYSINLSLVHSQESQADNVAGDNGNNILSTFHRQVVDVVPRAQQQPQEHTVSLAP